MMTPAEKLRFVLNRGKLIKSGDEWIWTAAPDVKCYIRELREKSKWTIIEYIYDILRDEKTR
jgi:hypothetical protein